LEESLMTSLMREHFGVPTRARDVRALNYTAERAVHVLSGRTVWCASGLPRGRASAEALAECLRRSDTGGVRADPLEVSFDEMLGRLAEVLDAMLSGALREGAEPGAAEREVCVACMQRTQDAVREEVAQGDLVVMHDSVSAMLAGTVRERGAHAIWHLTVGRTWSAESARSFMRPYTAPLDAYVDQAGMPVGEGRVLRRTVAVMPSAATVAETDIEARRGDAGHDVGWRSVLAEVAETDRSEHVGGRLHPRPAVAVR
jgi:hypothetical protein